MPRTPAHAAAVDALTALARERDPGTGDPCFAADLGPVLAATAANVGGLDTLLADVTDHWSAGLLRRLVLKAAGDEDAGLARFRTEAPSPAGPEEPADA